VRICIYPDVASTVAVRTGPCVACGTRLRAQRVFWEPVFADRDAAVRTLRQRVAEWREGPACCEECPERIARPAS